MLLRMLSDQRGSEDGFNIRDFSAGQEYEVSDWLGGVFIGKHWAEAVIDKQISDTTDGTDNAETSEVKPTPRSNRRRR